MKHKVEIEQIPWNIPDSWNNASPIFSTEKDLYIQEAGNKDDTEIIPAARIFMIDSGMLDCNGEYSHYGCLRLSQMGWFSKQSASVPGIIYMHIP